MQFGTAGLDQFTLTALGYQFPSAVEKYDANWLMMRLAVDSKLGRWEKAAPCLLTWEIAQLADWFAALAQGAVHHAPPLVESVIAFEVLRPTTPLLLQVHCGDTLHPAGLRQSFKIVFDYVLSAADLNDCAVDLRKMLETFPVR
jgi:hypothetical protein